MPINDPTMIKPKWEKIATNACGKGTYELNGWIIEHCGHPTANFPYMLFDPDGKPVLAANGRAHQTLAAAKQFAEDLWITDNRQPATAAMSDETLNAIGEMVHAAVKHFDPDHTGPVEFTVCGPNPIETDDEEEFFYAQHSF